MNRGLATTLDVLAKTTNEAAVEVLIPALDSPRREIQEAALQAILTRRNVAGQREIIRRLHTVDEHWKTIISDNRGRMSQALRDAVLDSDPQLVHNANQAILWFQEYDLIPTLVTAAEDESNPHAQLAAETLLSLCEQLYEELASPRDYHLRRDPQLVRRNVILGLEESTKHFARHKRQEIVESFLLLAGRENATLVQLLLDPLSASYVPLIQHLTHSSKPGVTRLVLNSLEHPQTPSAMISVIAHRGDREFVEHLLAKIGPAPCAAIKANLKKLESIVWLRSDFGLLDNLDDAGQQAAVQLLLASKVKPGEAYPVIEHLMKTGKPGGRRAAAAALAAFTGTDANQLALDSLKDPDPQVQAAILAQLRHRGIAGALPMLLSFVDSPHHVVRQAARDSLGEFGFQRFLAAYEMLDVEAARTTGLLVKRIDITTIPQLRQEMQSSSGKRRLRALSIVRLIAVVPQVLEGVLELMADDDHLVRAAAAAALGDSDLPSARLALEHALLDSSLVVQQAARTSLAQIEERVPGGGSQPVAAGSRSSS
ncbi:MAG TPA: HEAT repeat domain-containing protein [Pirellulales bacterium]|nr:HEAT repeat domain-containing protein [Pirellulales bacterium]